MGKKKSRAACPQHRRLSVATRHLAFAAAARSVLRETIDSFGPASAMGYIGSRNWPENRRSWIAGPDRASADYLRGVRADRHRSAFHFMMEVNEGCPADRIRPPRQGEGVSPFTSFQKKLSFILSRKRTGERD
jgi:hypothetical protein